MPGRWRTSLSSAHGHERPLGGYLDGPLGDRGAHGPFDTDAKSRSIQLALDKRLRAIAAALAGGSLAAGAAAIGRRAGGRRARRRGRFA